MIYLSLDEIENKKSLDDDGCLNRMVIVYSHESIKVHCYNYLKRINKPDGLSKYPLRQLYVFYALLYS